jgi:hypothetical protein
MTAVSYVSLAQGRSGMKKPAKTAGFSFADGCK